MGDSESGCNIILSRCAHIGSEGNRRHPGLFQDRLLVGGEPSAIVRAREERVGGLCDDARRALSIPQKRGHV